MCLGFTCLCFLLSTCLFVSPTFSVHLALFLHVYIMDLFCHHCQILSGPLNEVSHLMANNEFKKFNNEFNN